MPFVLILKLFLVPFLIYMVTLAGRRWGPGVAGWLSAFPIVAGPIQLTITLEQGADFAATAAEGTLLAVVAILVFSLAYAWASGRFEVTGSMICALFAYALTVAGLQAIHPPLVACFVLVWGALLLALRLFPDVAPEPGRSPVQGNDLPWRMLAGAVLVLSVTFAASSLGPRLSGFLAMFPVMGSVLVGFSHARSGRAFAVSLMRGMVYGYYAFSVFCLVVALALRDWPIALTFGMAFCFAFGVQIAVKRLMNMRRPA
ncbi:hypothetical protein [Massilia endophytica]|uniref:hypothetical protein n=1 Tax=Massilia endophytica TaxID=2899220 RepID=UPI001E3A54EC|nr:hypothetical protein [Massilia endophytica]UGQ46150.1 hypothetical protein LSQ66_20640 [Massilia endophytica]